MYISLNIDFKSFRGTCSSVKILKGTSLSVEML